MQTQLKWYATLRKAVAIAACLAVSATMFAQVTGVEINGVIWATRNVDAAAMTTIENVNGGRFTDNLTGKSIFLPAVGHRNFETAILGEDGYAGRYWSKTNFSVIAYTLYFDSNLQMRGSNVRAYSLPIRPVKDVPTGIEKIILDTENGAITGYIDILGRKLKEEPAKGLYIIQYGNGKTKKVLR